MGSLDDLRGEVNRLRVIDVLRERGAVSRAALAAATGLSRTTIAAVLSDLLANGFVIDVGARGERSGRGRPASLLALDASAGGALGIDFARRHVLVAVGDLASTVRAERRAELRTGSAADALDAAAGLVTEVLAEAGMERGRLVGAGVGCPARSTARPAPSARARCCPAGAACPSPPSSSAASACRWRSTTTRTSPRSASSPAASRAAWRTSST